MFDALLLMTLTALALVGYLVGMSRKRAQLWVRCLGPVGAFYLAWYFLFVILPRTEPALLAGDMETGPYTLPFMIGGIWALLARPKPPAIKRDDGAQAA